ncbi:MAG: hypothetical protein OEV25_09285, partial [Deltaproteobacteria bacterium]|nr:hypothetical protein [Deltaproteobacteria bacterium]
MNHCITNSSPIIVWPDEPQILSRQQSSTAQVLEKNTYRSVPARMFHESGLTEQYPHNPGQAEIYNTQKCPYQKHDNQH